ncbi:cupin domain-containing protein [Leifsonia sp. NPDC058248]|uniref:cupin domain-containing protein n=1 Tax=Leifsonia sp. NPDC058248 TaxID=3346402 RepID=UPI0036DD5ADB
MSRLQVYPWTAPDGLAGGTPHLHTACSEAYVVLEGRGRVQTLSADGFEETLLTPSSVIWFDPGVIHRLVNDGGLRLLVVMQNSGLPEAGDAVMTFPADVLDDRDRYRAAATLPSARGVATDAIESAVRERQARAVDGFTALCAAVESRGPAALEPVYAAARAIVAPRIDDWRGIWAAGAFNAAHRTDSFLAAMGAGRPDHLSAARLETRSSPDGHAHGMCGYLDVYDLAPAV